MNSSKINYNISDKELQTQIALGTANRAYLNPHFIQSRTNPNTIEALVRLWIKTPLPPKTGLLIADILIEHPLIKTSDKISVKRLKNMLLEIYKKFENLYENHVKFNKIP